VQHHAPYREYWNNAGRWLQPDPYDGSYDFSNPQSLNRYSYVGNNPLTFTDPSGQDGCLAAIAAGAEGGPIGEGISIGACVAELFGAGNLLNDLVGLFSGPSFHGSLTPRPESTGVPDWGNDPGSFGESLGIGKGIKTGTWGVTSALGLPDAGCEFGACGGGPLGFQNGATTAPAPLDWCGTDSNACLTGLWALLRSIPVAAASVVTLSMTGDNSGCIPAVGTQCHEEQTGHTHNGWDPHYHIWTQNQNPSTRQCFWNRGAGTKGTTQFPPSGMNACGSYPTWPWN
jgi:RHS repeat-associated protein